LNAVVGLAFVRSESNDLIEREVTGTQQLKLVWADTKEGSSPLLTGYQETTSRIPVRKWGGKAQDTIRQYLQSYYSGTAIERLNGSRARFFAAQVDYFGVSLTREEVLAKEAKYAELWTDQSYQTEGEFALTLAASVDRVSSQCWLAFRHQNAMRFSNGRILSVVGLEVNADGNLKIIQVNQDRSDPERSYSESGWDMVAQEKAVRSQIEAYYRSGVIGGDQLPFFAARVDYFGKAGSDHETIRNDFQSHQAKFRSLSYTVTKSPILEGLNTDTVLSRVPFRVEGVYLDGQAYVRDLVSEITFQLTSENGYVPLIRSIRTL